MLLPMAIAAVEQNRLGTKKRIPPNDGAEGIPSQGQAATILPHPAGICSVPPPQ